VLGHNTAVAGSRNRLEFVCRAGIAPGLGVRWRSARTSYHAATAWS